jgi:uncharacterized protein
MAAIVESIVIEGMDKNKFADIEFKRIRIEDRHLINGYLRRFPPQPSELNLTNMIAWSDRDYHYAVFDSHLIVRYEGNRFYQPVGPEPHKIIGKVLSEIPSASFERVDKEIAKDVDGHKAVEQRDQADYVYLIKELIELPGQRFAAKRNFVKRALKLEPIVSLMTAEDVPECIQLADNWCVSRQCHGDRQLMSENEATKRGLRHFSELGLHGIVVRIKGKIEAFAVGEPLNQDTFVDHFEKADTNHQGLYQFLLNEFAKSIPAHYVYLNREQDLGIEGLRKAKESYNPVKMIEKCTIQA